MPKRMRYVQIVKFEVVCDLPDDDRTPMGPISDDLRKGLAVTIFHNMQATMPPNSTLRDVIVESGSVEGDA